jgi:hypothetical protein
VAHKIFPLPEIVYPLAVDTIGKHLALGYEITAFCVAHGCHHKARVNLVALARRLGPEHGCGAADLRPHFFCARCRAAGRPDRNVTFIRSPPTDPHTDLGTRRAYPSASFSPGFGAM